MSGGEAGRGRRELHLHVGLPKTGTSFIQAALPLNRNAFAAAGFTLAPMMDPRLGAHHDLYLLEEREGPEALAAALEQAEGERFLASSEYFSRMLRDPRRLTALAAALQSRFEVKVYALLRRQDMQKESGYAQSVKLRRLGPIRPEPDPVTAVHQENNFYCDPDYERIVGNLEAAFGPMALRIGVFDPARAGDALDWFLDLLRVTPPDLQRPPRVNESVDRRRTLFLSHMAETDWDLAWFAFNVIRRTRRIRDDGGRYLMSPAERRAAMEPYLEGNRRIVERYGIAHADALLTLPESCDPHWLPAEPISLSEFLAVGVSMVRSALRRQDWPHTLRLRRAAHLLALTAEAALNARRHRNRA